MKKITLFLLLFVSTAFYAQSTGISYQAIIYNPNGEVIPGYNNSNAPLANKNICLQFTIVDSATLTEYQEKITVTTDEYGMVNTVIGTGIQTGGYATSFANVNWSLASKRLKVGLDTFGLCTSFNEISNQLFTSVPYALAAKNAENISGVVPIANGGTGATTVLGAKTNLGLENVDNTRDSNKPISTATQAALNLKEDLVNKSTNVITDGTSNTKYPSVKAIKDYVDSSTNSGGSGLANEAIIRANADLLKEDLINKSTNITTDGGSNTKYPSVKAIKDYVDVSINSGGTALTNEINTRAAADLLKEDLVNKSTNVTTDGASNTKYPSVRAIKTYVDASDSTLTSNLAAETTARIAGDNTLTSNLAAEISRATTIDNTLSNNVLQELIRATAAEATKEDLVNKSTNVTTDGTSNTKYPSVKSVKDYVDATVTTATALKENSANKSTDVTLSDATNVKFPTELAVKTYVNNQLASGTATNVSGVVAVANGGTGATTLTGILKGNGNSAITAAVAGTDYQAPLTLTTTGTGAATLTGTTLNIPASSSSISAGSISGTVAIANGGTGSNTQNFVDLTTAQTVDGAKTFSSTILAPSISTINDIYVNGIKVGKGGGAQSTIIGDSADASRQNNTALGFMTLNGNYGTDNTAVGTNSMRNSGTTSYNTAVGENSGAGSNTGSYNTFLGMSANVPNSSSISNATAIGYGAIVSASNTIQLGADGSNGTTAISNVKTSGKLTTGAVTYPNTDGSANQVLLTNGSGVVSFGPIPTLNQNTTGTASNVTGIVAVANGGTGSSTQNFVDLTSAQTVAGVKIFSDNVIAPSVTSSIYVSTPQVLPSGANITWNPANGSNASVTLNQNSILSFSTTPTAGTYGTLVVIQDGTGGRTLALPSTTNRVLGSSSTTSIALSTAAGARDIVNFYYDGTNCYWNIGQGYGIAATVAPTNLVSAVTGTLPVANGGTGSSTQNFVDLTTPQTIAGNKNFSGTITAGPINSGDINAGTVTANASISSEITTSLIINNANAELYKGKVLICNPSSQITITFNSDIPTGFNCMVLQKSADANKINFAAGSGVVLKNRSSYTATAGNYAIATIVNIGGGIIVTAGDMQ